MKADLNQLAIEADLDEGEIVLDAVVLMRIVHPNKKGSALLISTSPGMDWISQLGMVEAARTVLRHDDDEDDEDDD